MADCGLPWGYTRGLHRPTGPCKKPLFYGAFSKPFYYGGEGGILTPDSRAQLRQSSPIHAQPKSRLLAAPISLWCDQGSLSELINDRSGCINETSLASKYRWATSGKSRGYAGSGSGLVAWLDVDRAPLRPSITLLYSVNGKSTRRRK